MKDKFFTALENLLLSTSEIDIAKHRQAFMVNSAFLFPKYSSELSDLTVSVKNYANNSSNSNKQELESKIDNLKTKISSS